MNKEVTSDVRDDIITKKWFKRPFVVLSSCEIPYGSFSDLIITLSQYSLPG
jgi:hypothetical protein